MIDDSLVSKVADYQPSLERLRDFIDTPMVLTVGISGAGKDTLTHELMQQYPGKYQLFVSHTTRPPRENHGVMEQDGREYHFIDFATADRMLDNHDFIEANVYSDNVYGTSVQELQRAHDAGKTLINDIDVNGVAHAVGLLPACKPIFILPPSYEVWKQRLMKRYTAEVDKEDWRWRMLRAKAEIEQALSHDYFYLLVNQDLQEAAAEIDAIAQGTMQDHRPARAVAAAQDILLGLDEELANQ